jgi:hypothetical protein
LSSAITLRRQDCDTSLAFSLAANVAYDAIDSDGHPDFGALLIPRLDSDVCVWVFDILSLRGQDLRPLPLVTRRYKLDRVMGSCGSPLIQYSEFFSDPYGLLAACGKFKLEGIVATFRGWPVVRTLLRTNDTYNAAGGGLLASGLSFSALFAIVPGLNVKKARLPFTLSAAPPKPPAGRPITMPQIRGRLWPIAGAPAHQCRWPALLATIRPAARSTRSATWCGRCG